MKSIKLALMAGAAIAVSAAAAQADDLEALKAQIETLNARVAAMETAPSVPAGYSLLAISEGELQQTPGLDLTAQEKFSYGNKSTMISVLPTADAPAGATISWSGYARAGLVYQTQNLDVTVKGFNATGEDISGEFEFDPEDETDVKARGQIRVTASTDTAVGEIGVDLRVRGNFDGVSQNADAYMDVAWGYWAMTPELTLGGGYAGSLGNVGYGFDGACNCYYNDYGDIGFNPGDTTQFRLSYASGPLSMAVALEDASYDSNAYLQEASDNQLGVAGELKYSGDAFNGEISAVYRSLDDDNAPGQDVNAEALPSSVWQVGAGVAFNLGEMASLSVGAAMGYGPFNVDTTNDDNLSTVTPWANDWWGVSAIASASLSDEISAEIGGGYKSRTFEDVEVADLDVTGDYDTWSVAGGIYYQPVDQLTIGVESAYWVADWTVENDGLDANDSSAEFEADSFTVDLVSVWRF